MDVPLNDKTCHQIVQKVTNWGYFWPIFGYFSLNIGHSDLYFCMQVDVAYRGHNHMTNVTSA